MSAKRVTLIAFRYYNPCFLLRFVSVYHTGKKTSFHFAGLPRGIDIRRVYSKSHTPQVKQIDFGDTCCLLINAEYLIFVVLSQEFLVLPTGNRFTNVVKYS